VYQLPGQPAGATIMQGLDSLAARLTEYKKAGAVFAKWRSPLAIDEATDMPSELTIQANMQDLARYALVCQDVGLVPIVEPDVSMSGTHSLEAAVAINVKIQSTLYKAMLEHGVFMEGAILKSNIVNPGKKCPTKYSVKDIAQANIDVFRRCMPVAIRSANFLSGGQSLEDASARLSVMNQLKGNFPVNLSFSWSAALQMPLFALCKGELKLKEMEALYLKELAIASAAASGTHVPKNGEGDHKGA
jgi:fructose-bisphosphate aldolase, class I